MYIAKDFELSHYILKDMRRFTFLDTNHTCSEHIENNFLSACLNAFQVHQIFWLKFNMFVKHHI